MTVSIVTGVEEEDSDYILNNDDPLSEFDYDKPSRAEEIYNDFYPGRETLNKLMLWLASYQWKDGQLQLKIIWNTNEYTWESFPDMKEGYPRATSEYMVSQKRD